LKDIFNQILRVADPSHLTQLKDDYVFDQTNKSKTTLDEACEYFDELKKLRRPENVYKRSFLEQPHVPSYLSIHRFPGYKNGKDYLKQRLSMFVPNLSAKHVHIYLYLR
jgi:hypothetical protein